MKKITLAVLIFLVWIFFLNRGGLEKIYAQEDPYAPLKTAVGDFLKTSPNSGLLIVLPNGDTISNNPGGEFPAYSVIKLWIAAAVFADTKEQGAEVDSDTLSLIQRMLQNSDNNATNELLAQLGDCSNSQCDARIMQFAAENNYIRTKIRRRMLETAIRPENDNVTSPEDAVTFMQNLVNETVVDPQTSQALISILTGRTQSGTDPFKPNSALPPQANFIGKSGIMQASNSYNDIGTFLDANGNQIYFAIFAPNGGVGADKAISSIEQLIYNPSEQPKDVPTTGGQNSTIGNERTIAARACVKIGNPPDPMPAICSQSTGTSTIISGTGGNQGIVQAASQIVALLSKGSDNLLNVKSDEPGVYYWCTFLIADAYNQAGIQGVTRGAHAAVVNMKAFFGSNPGFQLLPTQTPVEQLQPGDVVFFEGSGQHVSLIKSIDINEVGNGSIHTYDSNNVVAEDVISVVSHQAQKANTTAGLYSITGFGRAVQ